LTAPDECDEACSAAPRAMQFSFGDDVTSRRAGGAARRTAVSLRDLASVGKLRQEACSGDARVLRSEAFQVVLPLVWQRHTRPLEMRKGHTRCAAGIRCLEPDCADGFTDDVESVVTALLAYRRPIANLEGWITARMANAIKDGYRMRRSRDMGAQQRARVPLRLAVRLGNDPWMVALADKVLQWAGVRHTAGTQLWPLGVWAEARTALVCPGEPCAGEAVEADLAVVLRTMREWDPTWYAEYVEQPLGRKWAPVAAQGLHDPEHGATSELAQLDLVPQHERDDARLAEAAAACLTAVRTGIAAGKEPRQAVTEALTSSFLADSSLCQECARAPFADSDPGAVVATILADPAALNHVVVSVMAIVA
jgi:hypothetical protein